MMEYVVLPKSDLKVSRLGFGCCPMGGHGWGEVVADDFKKAVGAALNNGVNLFDTADIYGLGESEVLLGKFLKGHRHEAVIATKFGVRRDNQGHTFYDNSPSWIGQALEGSLQRLAVECIDLYQVHYLDHKTPLFDVIQTLEKKRQEGKIRYFGLSNITLDNMDRQGLPEAVVSFQAEYSLANRLHEKEIREIQQSKELGFFSWGSLGQGILSGKYGAQTQFGKNDRRSRREYANFHGEKYQKNLIMLEQIRKKFQSIGKNPSQIAIRWILDHLEGSVALVGIKREQQILENIQAFGWRLSDKELKFLDTISL